MNRQELKKRRKDMGIDLMKSKENGEKIRVSSEKT